MSSSVEDLGAPPDSWEVADLDATMSRLMLSSKVDDSLSQPPSTSASPPELVDVSASDSATHGASSEDLVNSVDQFLREALQNPRERLSVLRMEQDVEKFIQDPTQQQMEFQQLPTSYLRLAAHRVAQHYSLQSMVLLDNNLPDSSASRIIVRKNSDARVPLIRLAEIPVNLPTEDNNGAGVVKVAIKQRPQKRSQGMNSSNANSSKNNSLKSVEERKEEYNRARARIFSSTTTTTTFKPENEARVYPNVTVGVQKVEENSGLGGGGGSSDSNGSGGGGRGLIESSSASSSKSSRSRTEKELPVARAKASINNNNINTNNNINNNNRVAIFRDREVERKDPDFDRSYDRYAQRFDPGFGFNGAGFTIQPMYAPVVNYNTEFPQLGGGHRPPPDQHHHQQHHRPLPQHLPPGGWAGGYGPQETMMGPPYSHHHHHHAGPPSPLYMHSAQYPCQRPGMPFIHPHDHLHQSYLQSQQQQQQHDASFGLARPR